MATRPTVGGSDGTWGTELNAHLDVSLDDDGKVDDGAAQTTSAAPSADAELANKKYTDDQVGTKENTLVTQSTASIFGSWTNLDSLGGTLVRTSIYRVGSDGFVVFNSTTGVTEIDVFTDSNSNPTTKIMESYQGGGSERESRTFPVRKDDYWKIIATGNPTITIRWLPIGTGTCVGQ